MPPKRMSSGEVVQQNYEPSGADGPNTLSETGPDLKAGYVVGKQGSVQTHRNVQTDCTKDPGGASMAG